MGMTTERLVRRFSLHALIVMGVTVAAAYVIFSPKIAFGVFVGGALGLLNIRSMARGVTGLDINNPHPGRLFFGGAVRLLVLFSAIVLIAMTKKVDLLGLLVGFTAVLIVVMVDGTREMMLIVREEQGQCNVSPDSPVKPPVETPVDSSSPDHDA